MDRNTRVVVTGGRGVLGRHVMQALGAAGYTQAPALGSAGSDLVREGEAARMIAEVRPDAIVHLAAVVGGIGVNRAHPGSFFFRNLMMGVQLMEEARLAKVGRFLAVGTICSYPKFTPVPFREE